MGGRETLRVEDKARMMAEPQGPPESRRETEVRASSLGEAKKSAGGSNNTCSWSHSPGGWKAKVKVSAGQVPLEPCPWFVCDGTNRCNLWKDFFFFFSSLTCKEM